MDAADLKARALKAREFEYRIGDLAFTLRTPSRHELRQAVHDLGFGALDGAELALLQYALTVRYMVAWSGVRLSHLGLAGQADASSPAPLSPAAVELLLDAQPTWADELGVALLSRVSLRNAAIDGDEKNSPPTSSAAATAWATSPPSA